MNSMITTIRRKKLAQASAGEISLPPIAGMALGTGGVDESGTVQEPEENLRVELVRRAYDSKEAVTDTCYRYSLALQEEEFAGEEISEMALYDADGDVVAVKTFAVKVKDADMVMIFDMDDQF